MATAKPTDLSKYIKGVVDDKDCYDTKNIDYSGTDNIDKPIMTKQQFDTFFKQWYKRKSNTSITSKSTISTDYISNFLEDDTYELDPDNDITNLKDNEALLVIIKEFNKNIKFTLKNGLKEIDCNFKVSGDSNRQTGYNALAKRVNASGILNNSKKKYFKNIVDKNWAECIKTPEILSTQNGLTVLHIPTKDKVVENSWSGVQAAVNSGNIYGMPAMRINMNGILIGGTEFLPQTAPKLSNDVSKILKSLLSNLKAKGIDLDNNDILSLNKKLNSFSEMEQSLLDDAVILAGFNKSATAPDFNEEGSVELPEMKRLNRLYENKMGRYTKMQRNFQDVIFAILQNCA